MSDPLEFTSFVGHTPWFFVPDTGTPGATAVFGPVDGPLTECTNTQVTGWADDPDTGERVPNPDSTWGPRVGFQVPGVLLDEGDYVMRITQDDVVTVYLVHVELDLVVLVEQGGEQFGVLNQLRGALGRKPFSLAPNATADGYSDREVRALDRVRLRRGVPALTRKG